MKREYYGTEEYIKDGIVAMFDGINILEVGIMPHLLYGKI